MTRYVTRRRAFGGLLMLLSLIVACGPGGACESDSDRSSREFQERMSAATFVPPIVTRLEAKLTVPVTTFTVTAYGANEFAQLKYEWSMVGEACGTPAAPWTQTGTSAKWSHSDQKPDSCLHKGTDHAVDTTVVVSTGTWRVTCTIHGTEDQVIDNPPCTQSTAGGTTIAPTPTPTR